MLWLVAIFGGLSILSVGFALGAQQLGHTARRRRLARKTPIRPISEGKRNELIRIRGIVCSPDKGLVLPFTQAQGVFHFTQLVDSANPAQTTTLWRRASCGFLIEDQSGRARIPADMPIELIGREPEAGGVGREEPALAEFLGEDIEKLFSKGGWLVWRQDSLCVGDEVVAWGRVLIEPDPDPGSQEFHYREAPLRVALAPVEPNGPVLIELVRRPSFRG